MRTNDHATTRAVLTGPLADLSLDGAAAQGPPSRQLQNSVLEVIQDRGEGHITGVDRPGPGQVNGAGGRRSRAESRQPATGTGWALSRWMSSCSARSGSAWTGSVARSPNPRIGLLLLR